MKATDRQVGGNHYNMPYQPIKFITENNLNFIQGNIVKYVSRYKNKNGLQDLEKALHYAELGQELDTHPLSKPVFTDACGIYCSANHISSMGVHLAIYFTMLKRYSDAANNIKTLIKVNYGKEW